MNEKRRKGRKKEQVSKSEGYNLGIYRLEI